MKKILIYSALIVLCSCKADVNAPSPIPDAPVNFSCNIYSDTPELLSQGGFVEVTEPFRYGQYIGYGGLLIFHAFDNHYYAYDLSCPNECKRDIKITPSMAGTAKCESCGASYDIGFGTGSPLNDVCKYPLRKYNVTEIGTTLRVTQ